jgi:glycosyltransferase involved in cell wall biosynthesis
VVYLGLLAPYQGTDLLLRALAHLEYVHPRPFTLIMGFPNVERYQQMARSLGLAPHVHFTGAIPFEAAPMVLALGDVAVAPKLSATEGSGKLLTYMAAGLPIVATDTPVHREYLGELGFYAAPGDSHGLAAALVAAITSPQRISTGDALRRRATERYTWDHAATQIEDVYDALL